MCLRACSLTNPACNAPPYCHFRPLWLHHIFRHYLINGTIFGKNATEHKMCVLIFSKTSSETLPILRRIYRDIVINLKTSRKESVFPIGFYKKLNFLDRFSKNLKYHTSLKSVQSELSFHSDRRMDMTKLSVVFRNFANAPTNGTTQWRSKCSFLQNGLNPRVHNLSTEWRSVVTFTLQLSFLYRKCHRSLWILTKTINNLSRL